DSPSHAPLRGHGAGGRGAAEYLRDAGARNGCRAAAQHRAWLHRRRNCRDYRYLAGGGEETSVSCKAAVAHKLHCTRPPAAGVRRPMNTQPETPKPPCPPGATFYADLLPQLRAGTLSQHEQDALRQHLRACVTCREEAVAATDQMVAVSVRRQYGIPAHAA